MKKYLLFLMVVVPIVALLYFSLTRNPRQLPAQLIQAPTPHFSLSTLSGDTVSSEQFAGQAVVLNFWATWCGPCVSEHHIIQAAIREFAPQGIRFYSILYEDTPERANAFLQQYGPAAPVLLDPQLKTAINFGVSGVPETFFIAPNGTILHKESGALQPETLRTQVEILLKAIKP